MLDKNFEHAAKTYMRTSQPETLEKFPEIAESEDAKPIIHQKNDTDIGTIILVAQPPQRKQRPKSKSTPRKPSRSKAKGKKKKITKKRSFSFFRVIKKR